MATPGSVGGGEVLPEGSHDGGLLLHPLGVGASLEGALAGVHPSRTLLGVTPQPHPPRSNPRLLSSVTTSVVLLGRCRWPDRQHHTRHRFLPAWHSLLGSRGRWEPLRGQVALPLPEVALNDTGRVANQGIKRLKENLHRGNEIRAGDEPHHDIECVTQQLREHVNEATENDDGGLHHHLHQRRQHLYNAKRKLQQGPDLSKDSRSKVVSSDAPSATLSLPLGGNGATEGEGKSSAKSDSTPEMMVVMEHDMQEISFTMSPNPVIPAIPKQPRQKSPEGAAGKP